MRTIIVGGNFGDVPRASKIISILADSIQAEKIYNGGTIQELKSINLNGFDLIIWAPNIDNSIEKIYPKKDKGSVLIVSKVLRENRTIADALKRIFLMHGNAVIAVTKNDNCYSFQLIDALNNTWKESQNINDIVWAIKELYIWTKNSIRMETFSCNPEKFLSNNSQELSHLIEINKQIAIKVEQSSVGRHFGNLSTRCFKLFPTSRHEQQTILVSKRNVNKKYLVEQDMILAFLKDNKIGYFGSQKPSVDTPIQLTLYNVFPKINYMIHGHAFIKNALDTKHYFPCGDLREINEVKQVIVDPEKGIINLKQHGFLIYADTIENLQNFANNLEFID